MNQARFIFVALALAVISQPATAQDRLGYRAFVLESSVDTVLSTSGARVADVKVLHQRPAVIQELEWRAPYARAANEAADPVRQILFSFCDNALYQVLVSYDPDRTDGLSNADIIRRADDDLRHAPARRATGHSMRRRTPWCSRSRTAPVLR